MFLLKSYIYIYIYIVFASFKHIKCLYSYINTSMSFIQLYMYIDIHHVNLYARLCLFAFSYNSDNVTFMDSRIVRSSSRAFIRGLNHRRGLGETRELANMFFFFGSFYTFGVFTVIILDC